MDRRGEEEPKRKEKEEVDGSGGDALPIAICLCHLVSTWLLGPTFRMFVYLYCPFFFVLFPFWMGGVGLVRGLVVFRLDVDNFKGP